ncbi:MAG: hypothetical protein LBE84_00250 [Planctomycetota bacterium]|jgi:hypothetical protein|nr:hypothetical protein [Planctomycetota bacterium]
MTKASLWGEAVSKQKESGLSAAEFCRREGLRIVRFYYWRKKLLGKSKFAEVHVVADDFPVTLQPGDSTASLPAIEILLLSGERIRLTGFSSLNCLGDVVKALRERPC